MGYLFIGFISLAQGVLLSFITVALASDIAIVSGIKAAVYGRILA